MFRGWGQGVPGLKGLDFKHTVLGREKKSREETMSEKNKVGLKQKDPVHCEPFQLAHVLSDL